MEYRRFDTGIVVRLRRGEKISEKLIELAKQENIKLASLRAIGAVDEITLGWYDVEKQQYRSKTLHGQYEITGLMGTLTTMGGEPYLHLHITIADESYRALGGHLEEGRISGTFEAIIWEHKGEVDRVPDPETGLNILKLSD